MKISQLHIKVLKAVWLGAQGIGREVKCCSLPCPTNENSCLPFTGKKNPVGMMVKSAYEPSGPSGRR